MADIIQRPRDVDILVVEDYNTYLTTLDGKEPDKIITLDMVMKGLEEMEDNLLLRYCHWTRDETTRSIFC